MNNGDIHIQSLQSNKSSEPSSIEREIADIMGQYPLGEWRAIIRNSGMNNTTRLIETDSGRYAIRLYDNHQDRGIVALEHEMLEYLIASNFSLDVPVPVRNASGETITASARGKLASLFRYIDGERPLSRNMAHVRSLGRATGMLSAALAHFQSNRMPVYDPYYELDQSYEHWTDENVLALAAKCSLGMEAVRRLVGTREQMREFRLSVRRMPHQWIHGDLNFSNAVAVADEVVGVLDFEFCTIDLRAMEPAVVMVDFVHADRSEEERLLCITEYAAGFGEARRLTVDEADAIPGLMKLRMLDVFLHFARRCSEGLDDVHVWEGQIRHADAVCSWIDSNELALKERLRSSLGE